MWQEDTIENVTVFFKNVNGIQATILIGSFANENAKPDEWSDIDFAILGEGHVIDKYMDSLGWLDEFGSIFAFERNELDDGRVLRVCFEDFNRIDFLFIPSSEMEKLSLWHFNPFQDGFRVLFSKVEGIESLIGKIPRKKEDGEKDIMNIAESFWFKATYAIYKVVRNDMLIAAHLTLDLVRDCLVLRMKIRDTGKNEIEKRRSEIDTEMKLTPIGILDTIEQSAKEFDALAKELEKAYEAKSSILGKWIEKARENLDIM